MTPSPKSLNEIIKDHKYFYYPFFVLTLIGAIRLFLMPHGYEVLALNAIHNTFLDYMFQFWTFVGDGAFFVLYLLIVIMTSYRKAIIGFLAFALSGIAAQIIKRSYDMPRPKTYFNNQVYLYFVPGVQVHGAHSFPSGHTATGFAFFLFLSFITKNKKLGALYLVCALFVGASRIYLCQHFLLDVYFGALIGVSFTTAVMLYFENSKYLISKTVLDNGLGSKIPIIKNFLK